jgi:hypothetical protein
MDARQAHALEGQAGVASIALLDRAHGKPEVMAAMTQIT